MTAEASFAGIECSDGDVFPDVGQFHEHIHLVHEGIDHGYRLDYLWREAEALIPKRHSLQLSSNLRGTCEARAVPPFMDYPEWQDRLRVAWGDSPADAIEALIDVLRTHPVALG